MPAKNYYEEIKEQYRQRRKAAEKLSDDRKSEVYAMCPEVWEIDRRLSATGMKILDAAAKGGDVQAAVAKIKEENEELRKKRGELLRAAGFPADFTDLAYTCPECRDSGFVGVNMCSCMKIAVAEAKLLDSEIGVLAKKQSFDNFSFDYYSGTDRENIQRNFASLKAFAEEFGKDSSESWLLMGETGLGKTHLTTSVGAVVIRRGYDVVYRSMQGLMDDFERTQFHGGDPEEVQKYYRSDLLIIDDLGAEMTTQFTVSSLYNVVNTRINAGLPTLISTNLTQSQLRERYTDRITSRLFGEYRPLLFRGTDIRRQKLAKQK